MMRRSVAFGIFFVLAVLPFGLWSQTSKTLPSDPAEFIAEFSSRMNKLGTKDVQQYAKGFEERWNTAAFNGEEQMRFINQVNNMLERNYALTNEVVAYSKLFELVKSEEKYMKIGLRDFVMVTDSCLKYFDRKNTSRYFSFMSDFVGEGAAFKTSNATWTFTQQDPKVVFKTVNDQELNKVFRFPQFLFSNTDLVYRSKVDSTVIYNTGGALNAMNKVFLADGGKIDWSKMGLDPNDVYVELQDYMLNLNYSFVDIDTVTFHYSSLIDRPLKGKYEDVNKGYRNINKANYPYFRSYEGGVVIENFIPNVRYEGGFSLRGVRKIGSAYYKLVDVVPEPDPEPEKDPEEETDEGSEDDEWDIYDIEDDSWEGDMSVYYLDGEEPMEDEEVWDEPDSPSESEDETGGGFFEEEELNFLDQELKLIKAKLTILRNGMPAMDLRAMEFVLDLEKLVSHRTEATVHIDSTDTIYHPSLDVLYLVDSSEVVLSKDNRDKFARQPFTSHYHNYWLYFDALRWKTDTDNIEFTFLIDAANELAAIESKDYFNYQRWKQIKNMVSFHPIGAIYRHYMETGQECFNAQEILEKYNKMGDLEALKFALVDAEGSGYVDYDPTSLDVCIKQKAIDWSQAARGKKDYDAIQIISQVKSGNNAELDLNNKELTMEGVPFFSLSDSQFVRVKPYEERITITENRDLDFGGVVAAGKLNFYGISKDKFKFEYENYKILCDSLDSLRFILVREVPPGFQFSKLQKALRNTSIEGVTGAVYINKPTNKNGLEPHPEYPVFDSYTNSYVYWAKIHGGAYKKDKFFFSIDPFVLDSLETFDESKLSFEGEFVSSEIFPKFRQRLTVMEDYTLGLKQVAPDTGYPAFGGKGRFYNEIMLDGNGLHGDGKLEFLETTAESDSFQFFFDTVKAVTNKFHMPGGERNGAYFPEISANQVNYKWLTKKDEIELETVSGDPVVMFEGEGTFDGKMKITPEGVKGNGTVTMGNVAITSKEILFNEKDLKARKGTFQVADRNDPSKQLYIANDVAIDYNVSNHTSTFESEETGKLNSSFPEQQYLTSLSAGSYSKSSNDLRLQAKSVYIKDNKFVSAHPKQDSLWFYGKSAYYNFDEKKIEVDSVPYILVADARITPDQGKVTVLPDGYLGTLENANIEANLETKYHNMYESEVKIEGAFDYNGKGKYDYIPVNGKDQYINLAEIKATKDDTLTTAKGEIPEEQGFYLTERIFFKGNTYLSANEKFMEFEGEVKIESDNEFFKDNWFTFDRQVVNPDSVFIPIKDMEELTVGLFYVTQYRTFYSTFLQPQKKEPKNVQISKAAGGLTFDRITKEFRIGPKDKLTGKAYTGVTSSLNDSLNIITTKGPIDFPFNFGRNQIEVSFVGSWRDDMGQSEISTDFVVPMNFSVISKDAWSKLTEFAKTQTTLNEDVEFKENRPLIENLAELLDPGKGAEKNTQEFIQEVNNSSSPFEVKVAKNLPYHLVLSGVQFKYDPEYKSFYSNGEVGLIGINGAPINKLTTTNSKIEYNIGKVMPTGQRFSDTLRVYLEFGEDEITEDKFWVYFEFAGEVLNTASSDAEGYTAQLTQEIEKRKKSEGYRFELVTEVEKENFLSRFIGRYIFRE